MQQLRAVTYNRCSTEEESQKDALIKQVQESKNCIREQGWQLVDTYVEAKSGTTSKGRGEYNRLLQDLETDKFDIIVIKSQDRLMRNTKDWYIFLDRMQKNRKRLYMYLERKFYTPEDALITGIKAILAEEYSRELSKKITNAHRNRQKEGKSFAFTNAIYGLKKMPDKSIVIDEQEAEMVRMVFQLSANGYGTHSIAEILYRQGYRNRKGDSLCPAVLRGMLRNPIYKGTVVQNKRHYDFESKKSYRNPPSEWIYHKNAVPAIVDEALFDQANKGMDVRRRLNPDFYLNYCYAGNPELSGKMFCGLCGSPFYHVCRRRMKGDQVAEWKCSNYLKNGRRNEVLRRDIIRKVEKEDTVGCDNVHLDEKKLYEVLDEICRKKYQRFHLKKEELLQETLTILRQALSRNGSEARRAELERTQQKLIVQKNTLLEKLLDGVISDTDYKTKDQEIQEKLDRVSGQLNALEDDCIQNARLESRIASIRESLENGLIEKAQVEEMISNIKRIDVFPDRLEITFDSWAILGLESEKEQLAMSVRSETDKLTVICVPQKCSTSPLPMMEDQKRQILAYMREKPKITAKEIAEKMDVNLSLVHRRINALKAEGKIHYSVPNGKGEWIISE